MSRARPLVLLLLAVGLAAASPAGAAAPNGIVVSQVFGGGGNSGAPFSRDYVELFNRGAATVDLSGWTVQYATATGTSWSATALSGSLAPGRYLLVGLASGENGSALPTPDVGGTTNLSATSGKIALVRDATALTCGASAGSCAGVSTIEDLVGYGAASDYEGAGAAPSLSSTTAAIRGGGGCADTDVNSADLSAGAPAPRNSATAASPCSEPPPDDPPPGASGSANASVDVDVQQVLAVTLERPTLSFGAAIAGSTPAAISQRVTVLSNHAAGYALTVDRSVFAPADLPLALSAQAPAGGQLGAPFAGGALVGIPITPSSLTIGTTSAATAAAGDAWPTHVGFASPLPSVAAGRYTATLTFTVIGR